MPTRGPLYIAIAAAVLSLAISGCGDWAQTVSHTRSSLFGLDRTITLYANDGSAIRSWETKTQVEDQGGSFRFLADGKAITIAGTVIIEEK